jgi:hypothetical protein
MCFQFTPPFTFKGQGMRVGVAAKTLSDISENSALQTALRQI